LAQDLVSEDTFDAAENRTLDHAATDEGRGKILDSYHQAEGAYWELEESYDDTEQETCSKRAYHTTSL